jgi:hypothetical protein
MIYRDDLKIEFKAVPYGSSGLYHRLMYRISPDQDLTYYKEYSFLGIKFKLKKKFDTSWQNGWQYLTWGESCGSEAEPTTNPMIAKNVFVSCFFSKYPINFEIEKKPKIRPPNNGSKIKMLLKMF